MKKKYPGNRRTSVPADRHKRAVAYRHIRYAKSRKEDQKLVSEKEDRTSFFITADQDENEPERKNGKSVSETLSIPKIDTPEQVEKKEPESRKEQDRKKVSEKKKAEKKEKVSRKERKKAREDEIMDALLAEPVIKAHNILTDPAGCMAKVEKADHPTLSLGACIFWMLVKWAFIGFCIATFFGKFINANPFGFARLEFRDEAAFAAKLGGYGFVAELVNYLITGMICSSLKEKVDKKRLISIDTYGIPSCVILLAVSFLVIEASPLAGAVLFIATCVLMMFLKDFALSKSGVSTRRHMLSVFICTVLFLLCGYFFVKAACGNIWQILGDIMNI